MQAAALIQCRGHTEARRGEPAHGPRAAAGRAGTQSLSRAHLSACTHLGPGRGRQPHSSHVGAPDGLDLLQVLVKIFVHELCLKHKTVKRYITSYKSHGGVQPPGATADRHILESNMSSSCRHETGSGAELRDAGLRGSSKGA